MTKWTEAKATQNNDARTTVTFLYKYVFTRYGLPIEIVSDRGPHFLNEVIEYLLNEFMVIHNKAAPYHPQANGQSEHTNKILSSVLTKVVSSGRTDWEM
ncbi:DDE-type integrase/transposase/recombinase, partial [Enterobacter cloacae complex sp. 4DZ3-17B2]|uniref:DDE-type integrase/transposase/recombinase n=1 Tax=Enterobacter cloacae complex sp. 4DZ3-17B2 TaxID=2511990 RepID=UPI0013ED258F